VSYNLLAMFVRRSISKLGIAVGVVAFVVGVGAAWIFELRPSQPGVTLVYLPPQNEHCEAIRPEDGAYPWARQQVEEREFFRAFQNAVAADDRERVASMMRYPLELNLDDGLDGEGIEFIDSPRDLLSDYDKVFIPEVKAALAGVDPGKLRGERFFPNARFGEIEIFVDDFNDYPDCNFAIKIKSIRTLAYPSRIDRGLKSKTR
jgi:hypothetical protein